MGQPSRLAALLEFPLMQALFGRRARRFGLGMEIPSGPLAFKSRRDPLPLTELEQMVLVAAATGVSGWSFGVPFGPRTPKSHADFTLRFTGRTAPTAAGLGTPALFFTDDTGCYCTRTRDISPQAMRELDGSEAAFERILSACRQNTIRIRDARLDVPSSPPHILPPNLWWANRPGSTLFMPVGDASEECLGFLGLMIRHGVMVVDHDTGQPAGRLEPFVRCGLLDPEKRLPLAELLSDIHESLCLELGFAGYNIVLVLQAMGLGGLYFNGMDGLSALGANARDGIAGLGFRFIEDERWLTPNPVGLDGVYEALCPPNYPDMHAAVVAFVQRKFGPRGAYDPGTPGPWRDSAGVKKTVDPYGSEFVDCMTEVAQYIHDKYGKFPGIRSTIMLPGFVQAHHVDPEFYDTHYGAGAYLPTHAHHMERWHGR
ncbi:MAG TPA: hypothetical protein VM491_20510 [Burkholderiaceae bacterium]|nr:hypothetical protein [Burkholderiaceae bacterium]